MRKTLLFLPSLLLAAGLFSGCASAEKKFARGVNNTYEVVRGAEFRRSIEQTSLSSGVDAGFSYGLVHGIKRTICRTGMGVYEVVTAPFPPYHWIAGDYMPPGPSYPDSYAPGLMDDSIFATDTHAGFSGGDIAPFFPGSRFHVFDSP